MDPENLALTQRLHDVNQESYRELKSEQAEFRREQLKMREEQAMHREMLARIIANTECIPKLAERVDQLEATSDRHKGVLWLLGVGWTGITAWFGLHAK